MAHSAREKYRIGKNSRGTPPPSGVPAGARNAAGAGKGAAHKYAPRLKLPLLRDFPAGARGMQPYRMVKRMFLYSLEPCLTIDSMVAVPEAAVVNLRLKSNALALALSGFGLQLSWAVFAPVLR